MRRVWSKLDANLASIYATYLHEQDPEQPLPVRPSPVDPTGGLVNVTIQYRGDLAEIEALGFEPIWREGPQRATGTVDLAHLERLADHEGVISMRFGEDREPFLDVSVPDVNANQVWTFSSGSFSGKTGAGVIVGIIDTGIDWRHRFFFETSSPKATRILRIWDPGLVPTGAEASPPAGRLTGPSYGVEYTKKHIDDVLQGVSGAMPVRHRDCKGHGTHVASIAAGDGRSAFKHIGVAPEADLVMVKLLDLEKQPKIGATDVPRDQLFRDAVTYILKTADALSKKVVINMSFGSNLGPHDGFTDDEDFLTDTFKPATTGKICVLAAGNSGGKRQHARIEFAGAGSVDIPLELFDARGAKKLDFRQCKNVPGTRPAGVQLWYAHGGPTVTVSIDIPTHPGGFVAGPALGGAQVTGSVASRAFSITHKTETEVLRAGRGTVRRNLWEFFIMPHRNRHRLGTYTLRVASTGALTVHLWCRHGRREGMRVATAPIPANVHVEDRFLIGSDAGADNVVSVAAYNAEVATLDVTGFSSRGPLVDYGSGVPRPAKPEIGAPGRSVDAAKGRHAKPWKPVVTTPKSGTSMSAPHVAGAVALMLEKKPALTVSEAISTLKGQARTVPPPIADETGDGRLDAKSSFDNVT